MTVAESIDWLQAAESAARGKISRNTDLAPVTWFRVGGPAQVLFQPADEADLSAFLANLPDAVPVTVIGLGSNLLVRDGGIDGVVIRLSVRGFGGVTIEDPHRIRVGAAVPDIRFAAAAAEAGISGFAFYRGIPGGIGGALRMNAGAYDGETKDRLIELRAVDRHGAVRILSVADMGYAYRHSDAPADLIFTEALYQGEAGDRETIERDMAAITEARQSTQPVKSRTGGSTFKNPPGQKAWQLIDAAGCRGLKIGGAQVSEKHCNFLINKGDATATDLELLGETVRARVLAESGVRLHWEIRRLGRWPEGVRITPYLENE